MIPKTAIAPVISLLALAAQFIFHKEIPADIQDQIGTVVVNIVFIYSVLKGIFINHNAQLPEKQNEKPVETTPNQYSDNLLP